MSLGLIYKNAAHIFDEVEKKTPYLEYPLFQETGIVTSAFSTRLGGVSEGYYSSLNLSFDRGDDPARVLENFKRIGASMGVNVEDMVLSKQTHTTNVRVVTAEDKGKGVMRERNYTDVDGIVTFRGNSFRDTPSHGYADMTDFRLNKLWSADTGSLSSGSASGQEVAGQDSRL